MANMSDESETFLARWSKRKAEARLREPDAEAALTPAATAPVPATGDHDEPAEVALEDLPPIDSITAETDLTQWLRKKVPEEWKQAALSRMWAADPAISQFTGLADYAWDWNVPDGVPGFGPLRAADDVAQLLAQAIGQLPESKEPEAGETADEPADGTVAESGEQEQSAAEMPEISADASFEGNIPAPETKPELELGHSTTDDAAPIRRRRGGGALPS
jgi:Protein of unknown function (DUF3306)